MLSILLRFNCTGPNCEVLTELGDCLHTIQVGVNSPVCDLAGAVKRPEREADHSPPSSAEAKNAWSYTSTPSQVFMV
jgi:hypothetical protein